MRGRSLLWFPEKGGFTFNDGGRFFTIARLPWAGIPFRLYIGGFVLMLAHGHWTLERFK